MRYLIKVQRAVALGNGTRKRDELLATVTPNQGSSLKSVVDAVCLGSEETPGQIDLEPGVIMSEVYSALRNPSVLQVETVKSSGPPQNDKPKKPEPPTTGNEPNNGSTETTVNTGNTADAETLESLDLDESTIEALQKPQEDGQTYDTPAKLRTYAAERGDVALGSIFSGLAGIGRARSERIAQALGLGQE